jgi:SCP-2 sterol transfer family
VSTPAGSSAAGTKRAGSVPASGGPADQASDPSGLVTLVVGEAGRAGSPRSRSRPAGKAAGGEASRPGGGQEAKPVTQWSLQWSSHGPGPLLTANEDEADLTLTIGTDEARLVREGELAPSVAFMRGRLKSTGDNALLLRILAWSATPAFNDALATWSKEAD